MLCVGQRAHTVSLEGLDKLLSNKARGSRDSNHLWARTPANGNGHRASALCLFWLERDQKQEETAPKRVAHGASDARTHARLNYAPVPTHVCRDSSTDDVQTRGGAVIHARARPVSIIRTGNPADSARSRDKKEQGGDDGA